MRILERDGLGDFAGVFRSAHDYDRLEFAALNVLRAVGAWEASHGYHGNAAWGVLRGVIDAIADDLGRERASCMMDAALAGLDRIFNATSATVSALGGQGAPSQITGEWPCDCAQCRGDDEAASPADGDTSAAAYARGHVLMARLGGPPAPAYAGVPCVFEDGAPTAAVGSAFTDGDGTTLGIFVPPPPDSVAGTVRVRLNDEGRRRFAAAGAGRPFSIGYDVADEPKGRPTIRAVTRYAGPTCGPIPCHRCGRPLFGMNCATCNPVPDDEPEGRP
jgi:hypothetical protein